MRAGLRGGGEVGFEWRCTSVTITPETLYTGSHNPKHVNQSKIEHEHLEFTLEVILEGGERETADVLQSFTDGKTVASSKSARERGARLRGPVAVTGKKSTPKKNHTDTIGVFNSLHTP